MCPTTDFQLTEHHSPVCSNIVGSWNAGLRVLSHLSCLVPVACQKIKIDASVVLSIISSAVSIVIATVYDGLRC